MKKGFTLIELLVVVLIIGILSAIALPQYTTAVEKSRLAEALGNLRHAQQTWELQYLQDPSGTNTLTAKDIMELSGGTWKADGKAYCTKNFRYTFTKEEEWAYRCTPKADCSACADTTRYSLVSRTPYSEDWPFEGDRKVCYGDLTNEYGKLAKAICHGLEGTGFRYNVLED